MKGKEIHNQLKGILTNMGIREQAITDKASFYKDLGLDSLDFAEMIMVFESTFKLDIPMLEAEQIQTIKQARIYIENRYSIEDAK